jgi:hypothetical protein
MTPEALNAEDTLELKKALKETLSADLENVANTLFCGIDPEIKKQLHEKNALLTNEKLLHEVFNEGIFEVALKELIERLKQTDDYGILYGSILDLLVEEDEYEQLAVYPLTTKIRFIKKIINYKLNQLALIAGKTLSLEQGNNKTVDGPTRMQLQAKIAELVQNGYITLDEIKGGIEHVELQNLLKDQYPEFDWDSGITLKFDEFDWDGGIKVSKKDKSDRAYAKTQELHAITIDPAKQIKEATSVEELAAAQEAGEPIALTMPPDVENIEEEEESTAINVNFAVSSYPKLANEPQENATFIMPDALEDTGFKTLPVVNKKGQVIAILPILANPVSKITDEVSEIIELQLREEFAQFEYQRQITAKIREIRREDEEAFNKRRDKEGIPLIRFENEDPDFMEVSYRKPLLEVESVSGGYNQKLPFFFRTINVGGARFTYIPEKRKFTVKMPKKTQFQVTPGDKITIGKYTVTVLDEHGFSKNTFVSSLKEMTKRLTGHIFDVNKVAEEEAAQAHERIRLLIQIAQPDESGTITDVAKEEYEKGIKALTDRIKNWQNETPIADSRVFPILQLMLQKQSQDPEIIGNLPFKEKFLQKQAERRISRYLKAGERTQGATKSFFQKLKEDMNPTWFQEEKIIANKGKIEIARFMEMNLFDDSRLSIEDHYQSDILAIYFVRKEVSEIFENEYSPEELSEAIDVTSEITLDQIFGEDEIIRLSAKCDQSLPGNLKVSEFIKKIIALKAKDKFEIIRKSLDWSSRKNDFYEVSKHKEQIIHLQALIEMEILTEVDLIMDVKYHPNARRDIRQFLNDVLEKITSYETKEFQTPTTEKKFSKYDSKSAHMVQHYELIRKAIQLGPIDDFSFLVTFPASGNEEAIEKLIAAEYYIKVLEDKLMLLNGKLEDEEIDEIERANIKMKLRHPDTVKAITGINKKISQLPRKISQILRGEE